jgi:hypothetical protein
MMAQRLSSTNVADGGLFPDHHAESPNANRTREGEHTHGPEASDARRAGDATDRTWSKEEAGDQPSTG